MRGRGGGPGGGGGGPGMKPRPLFIPHVPFDPVLAEPCFPPVRSVPQEQEEAFQQVRRVVRKGDIGHNGCLVPRLQIKLRH